MFVDKIATCGALAAVAGATGRGLGAVGAAGAALLFNPVSLGAGALLASTSPANAGENERARQLKYGQGWLSNAPPGAGAFSQLPSLGHYTELRGLATISNSLQIDLAPGLIAKEVRNAIAAEGNLRADTGVSMPPSMLR